MFRHSRRPVCLSLLLAASLFLQSFPLRNKVVFAAPNVAVPAITATMTDTIVPTDDGDGKVDPGGTEKIQYTINISNSGTDATGVQFNDTLDTHTTLVNGSLNASPIAGDDAFTAIGNTLLVVGTVASAAGPRKSITGNLLTNDVDFLGDTFTISAFDATSTNGGTVNVVTSGGNAGSFSYISAANFTGTDTFNYTIRDDGTDGIAGNSDDFTSVATVTITVANQVWYVDSSAAGGDGRSTTPFDALADVTGATGPDTTGDIIYLRTGSGNYVGGIALLVGQTLWGENETLIVDGFTLQASGTDPVITNAAGDGVTLPATGNNTLKGFTVGNTSSYDIAGTPTTSVGSLSVSNVNLNGTGGLFRADAGGVLSITFDSASTSSASANGIQLGNTSGSVTISSGAISGVAGTDVLISGGTVSLSCAGSITHAANSATVNISGHNTGTITFTGAVDVTGGTGLQFDNADSTTSYNFNGTTNLHGGDAGVDIVNGSSGSFSFSSSTTIANPTGIAFNVSASNPNVTYSGSITTNANRPLSVSNASAAACGTITFQTGSITANSGSNGLLVNNCNSGTVTFSGSAVSLTTTTNAGVALTNNGGASINFSGGNLDVLTTTGKPFTATGGGTIRVGGSSNTLATESDASPTGNTILEVTDTTIGSGGLNFVSLTGHGASSTARGVYLKSAGTGGLTVTGTGSTAGSGGTITNYTQKGILIDNTSNISLSNMNLAGNGTANLDTAAICGDGYNGTNSNCAAGIDLQTVSNVSLTGVHVSGGVQMGINGKNVTDLTLTNVEVNNAGNEVHEDGIQIHNLFGTKTWNNINIHDNAARQMEIQNASGTNNITITNSFFTAVTFQSPTIGSQAILFSGHGTSNITITVLDTYFTNCYSAAIQTDTADSAVAHMTVERATMEDTGQNFIAASSGSGDFTYALRDSVMWNDPAHSNSGATSLFKGNPASGNFRGEVTGNTFGKVGLAQSGAPCSGCVAISVSNADAPSGFHEVLIANNTIQRTGGGGINVTSGSGTGNDGSIMRVKILNNTIKDPDNASGALAITVVNATAAGDDTQTCADIKGNIIQDAPGGGSWNPSAAIRIRHVQNNTVFRLPGYIGGATDVTAVQNFLNAQNTLQAGYVSSVTLGGGSGTFGNSSPAGNPCFLMLALLANDQALTSELFGDVVLASSDVTTSLTRQQLDHAVATAIQNWEATGLTSQQLQVLRSLKFEIADLDSSYLGEAANNRVLIDLDAGGQGWYTASDSLSNAKFDRVVSGTRRHASETFGRVDLLTTIEHEMGHKLGLPDSYTPTDRDSIMYGWLTPGERRSPVVGEASHVKIGSQGGTQHLRLQTNPILMPQKKKGGVRVTPIVPPGPVQLAPACINDSTQVCVAIGTLKQTDTVTIRLQVTVNNPPNLTLLNPARVSTQGLVSYNESGSSVLTDDTSVAGSANATETEVDLFNTSTTVITSGSPSDSGNAVTFTATVNETPAQGTVDPTGTVQFLDGATPLTCSEGGVNGVRPVSSATAMCTTSSLAAGARTINANYSGDGNFDSSSGSVSQTVNACSTNPVVTSTADSGAGTLREALANVCSAPNNNVTFNLAGPGPHTITLTSGPLVVSRNVVIRNSSGESINVSGGGVSRVFNINTGITAALIGLTISGGQSSGNGGAILNDGTLTIVNSTLAGNNAVADGGAISTSTSLTLINTTLSGNNAGGSGGGVSVFGGTMSSINSTITNNRADNDNNGVGNGGGIRAAAATTTLANTIVAGNFNEDGAADAADDINGAVNASSSFNLIGDAASAGGLTHGVNNNIVGNGGNGTIDINTVLQPALANNGGTAMTHALVASGLAVETGSNANLPVDTFDVDDDANTAEPLPVDQRGISFPRVTDSADNGAISTVDIGAFELHPAIEDITDKTTAEDTAVPQFTFNIGDNSLVSSVTASSNNVTLIPNVLVGGSGATRTLDISPALNVTGTATITVTVTATNGQTAIDTFVVTVTEVNDAPNAVNDSLMTIDEDSGMISVPFATLFANDNAGPANENAQSINVTGISNPIGGTVQINGTNVEFTPATNFSGTASFDYTITDNGTTNGVADPRSDTATVSFSVSGVNDGPVNTVPGAQSTNQNTTLTFSSGNQISVADIDAGTVQVTLTATNGTVTLNGTTGLNFSFSDGNGTGAGDGTADPTMTFRGSLSNINTALNGMSYVPSPGFSGAATLTVTTNDLGNTGSGGPLVDTDVVNIQVSTNITIQDAKSAEPTSGTAGMLFTVTLSAPAPATGVSVNFTTMDEPPSMTHAVAGQDYTTTSGTVSFAAGEQFKTIAVPVLADASGESNETFLLVLSAPVNGTIADDSASGTILSANLPGAVLISELRTTGPTGPGDDFVEVYNNSNSPLTVNASDASGGYGLFTRGADCNATPVLVGIIPNGTVIPARGHFLFVGSQYSLANYGGPNAAAGDATLSADLDNSVALFTTSNATNLSSANRLDAVGFGPDTGGNCDLLREGSNLPSTGFTNLEGSYQRDQCGKLANPEVFGACPAGDLPKDANNNVQDFFWADTAGTITAAGRHLGAPGPENLASPLLRSGSLAALSLDATQPATITPNRVRDLTPAVNATNGTLAIRRRFRNDSGGPVTRLRFRVVDISTMPVTAGIADLRVLTSSDITATGILDSQTCSAEAGSPAPPCTITIRGTTLESPPLQLLGGGNNSTLTVTLATPLAAGASINVQWLLGVQTTGSFKFYINVEAF